MTSSIPGKAVDAALRLARFPSDQLLRLVPETAAISTLGLVIDRADAAVRGAAGSMLSDHGLREDAERRRAATDERKHAIRLRAEAQERVKTAEALTDEKRAESAARRKRADKKAEEKRVEAAEQRGPLKEQAEVKDAAIRAADEARRLERTAVASKEMRKANSSGRR